MTPTCRYQDTGAIDLYFYDEVDAAERDGIAAHVRHCRQCASTLEDLNAEARRYRRGRGSEAALAQTPRTG